MTTVAILPENAEPGGTTYRAVAGKVQAVGRSAGEALDALTAQLSDDQTGTLVIVQSLRPDRFFTAEQQQRLGALMEQWRTARDTQGRWPADNQAELEAHIEAELQAAVLRAGEMLDDAGK